MRRVGVAGDEGGSMTRASTCRNGHPRTPENMLMLAEGRVCKMCRIAKRKRAKAAAWEMHRLRAILSEPCEDLEAKNIPLKRVHAPLSKNCSREDWLRENGIKPKYAPVALDMRSL